MAYQNSDMDKGERLGELARRLWHNRLRGVSKDEVVQRVRSGGSLSAAFLFLVVTSCAIATLGLLLNSAAVIIGAMLIAPLMGPIVLLGFAVAATDVAQGISALKALLLGVATALLTSFVIVKLAPFIPPTAEILARTQPNVFDLLVAVIAGLVGGYAMVHREAGTVAGVAISTALMPPLASAGYGLGVAEAAIFQGAFFLFLTNMVAIALSAASVALWYDFGKLRTPRELLWKTFAGALLLIVLSIPLVRSLDNAVTQTLAAKGVEDVLKNLNGKSWQIGQLQVEDMEAKGLRVSALVFVPELDRGGQEALRLALARRFQRPVEVKLEQVEIGSRRAGQPVLASAPAVREPTETEILEKYLRKLVPFDILAREVDGQRHVLTLQMGNDAELGPLHQLESRLSASFPAWTVRVIPPAIRLPGIAFEENSSTLDREALANIELAAWALQRRQVRTVRVNGESALGERHARPLARARAEAVAGRLRSLGLEVQVLVQEHVIAVERESGRTAFRRVHLQDGNAPG